MKKTITIASAAFMLLTAAGISGSEKSDCLRGARQEFKADLMSCKEIQGNKAKRACVKEARAKVKAAKAACRNL